MNIWLLSALTWLCVGALCVAAAWLPSVAKPKALREACAQQTDRMGRDFCNGVPLNRTPRQNVTADVT
jgi:hypothetical protein